MSLLVKSGRSLLPSRVRDFIETGGLFSPGILDLEKDFFDINREFLLVPEANIIENGKDYKIELAVPGLESKDFKIEVENGVLSVSAEKSTEEKESDENYMRREFSFNSFCRTFTLPENVLEDKVNAHYEKGILKLTIPKKELTLAKPKKQIKVS